MHTKSQERVDLFSLTLSHAAAASIPVLRVTFNQHFAKQPIHYRFLCIKFAALCNIVQPLCYVFCLHISSEYRDKQGGIGELTFGIEGGTKTDETRREKNLSRNIN